MADSAINKSLQAALGLQLDEKAIDKLKASLSAAAGGVTRLSDTILKSVQSISASVTALAGKLEGLYFVSQRSGAAASSLKTFEAAMRNMGIGSETAFGAVEKLSRFLRTNQGGEKYLQAIGVQTRDANGQLRDTVEILSQLGQALAKRPAVLGLEYAEKTGVDENVLTAAGGAEYADSMQRYRGMAGGNDMDKATADAHRFMIQVRELEGSFDSFAIRLEGALLEQIGPQLAAFKDWFDQNSPQIADRVAAIAKSVIDVAAAIGPPLAAVVDIFLGMDRATDGWSTKLALGLGLFRALGGASLVAGVRSMAGALEGVGAAAASAVSAISTVGGGLWQGIKKGISTLALTAELRGITLPSVLRLGGSLLGGVGLALHSEGLNQGEEDELKRRKQAAGIAVGSGGLPRPALDAMAFFQRLGWNRDQAAGIVANLHRESSMNPARSGDNGQAYGLAQWHPDRQAAFKAWAGKDIRQAGLAEQLGFVHYELTEGKEWRAGQLLKAARNAQQAGEIVSREYERPGKAQEEAGLRGRAAVQLAQETNINIYGATDAANVAQSAAAAQRGVNADMVRNLQGAIQ